MEVLGFLLLGGKSSLRLSSLGTSGYTWVHLNGCSTYPLHILHLNGMRCVYGGYFIGDNTSSVPSQCIQSWKKKKSWYIPSTLLSIPGINSDECPLAVLCGVPL